MMEEGMRIGEEKEEWVASDLRGSRRNKNATYLLLELMVNEKNINCAHPVFHFYGMFNKSFHNVFFAGIVYSLREGVQSYLKLF